MRRQQRTEFERITIDADRDTYRAGFRTKGNGQLVNPRWRPVVPPQHIETVSTVFAEGEQALDPACEDKIRKTFHTYDVDGNGSLDAHELSAALKSVGMYEGRGQVRAVMSDVDADGNGRIELRELLHYFRRNPQRPVSPTVAEAEAVTELVCPEGRGPVDCAAVTKLLDAAGLDGVDPKTILAMGGNGELTGETLREFLSPASSRSSSVETGRPPPKPAEKPGSVQKPGSIPSQKPLLRAAGQAVRTANQAARAHPGGGSRSLPRR